MAEDASVTSGETVPSRPRLREIVNAGQQFVNSVRELRVAELNPPEVREARNRVFVTAQRLSDALGGLYGDPEVNNPVGWSTGVIRHLQRLVIGFESLIGGKEPDSFENLRYSWGFRKWRSDTLGAEVSNELTLENVHNPFYLPFKTEGENERRFAVVRKCIRYLELTLNDHSCASPGAPSTVDSHSSGNEPPAPVESASKAEAIDYQKVIDDLYMKKRPTRARLVEFMRDRNMATFIDIGKAVHDDESASSNAIKNNVTRTNESLEECQVPLRFRCASERVFKEELPE